MEISISSDNGEFVRTTIKLLGHIISSETMTPDPEKVAAVQKIPVLLALSNFTENTSLNLLT
jgi:hypothetical protein